MSSYSTVTTRTFIITGEMRDFCSASKKKKAGWAHLKLKAATERVHTFYCIANLGNLL